jgi:hypothetical protein
MTQNIVRRRYKEEEIRQGELLQIVVAFQFAVIAACDMCTRSVEVSGASLIPS